MLKKDSKKIEEIKKSISKFTSDAIELAVSVNSISEIIFDYCAYNANKTTGNIITLAEILKNKSDELIDTIDSEAIEILNL